MTYNIMFSSSLTLLYLCWFLVVAELRDSEVYDPPSVRTELKNAPHLTINEISIKDDSSTLPRPKENDDLQTFEGFGDRNKDFGDTTTTTDDFEADVVLGVQINPLPKQKRSEFKHGEKIDLYKISSRNKRDVGLNDFVNKNLSENEQFSNAVTDNKGLIYVTPGTEIDPTQMTSGLSENATEDVLVDDGSGEGEILQQMQTTADSPDMSGFDGEGSRHNNNTINTYPGHSNTDGLDKILTQNTTYDLEVDSGAINSNDKHSLPSNKRPPREETTTSQDLLTVYSVQEETKGVKNVESSTESYTDELNILLTLSTRRNIDFVGTTAPNEVQKNNTLVFSNTSSFSASITESPPANTNNVKYKFVNVEPKEEIDTSRSKDGVTESVNTSNGITELAQNVADEATTKVFEQTTLKPNSASAETTSGKELTDINTIISNSTDIPTPQPSINDVGTSAPIISLETTNTLEVQSATHKDTIANNSIEETVSSTDRDSGEPNETNVSKVDSDLDTPPYTTSKVQTTPVDVYESTKPVAEISSVTSPMIDNTTDTNLAESTNASITPELSRNSTQISEIHETTARASTKPTTVSPIEVSTPEEDEITETTLQTTEDITEVSTTPEYITEITTQEKFTDSSSTTSATITTTTPLITTSLPATETPIITNTTSIETTAPETMVATTETSTSTKIPTTTAIPTTTTAPTTIPTTTTTTAPTTTEDLETTPSLPILGAPCDSDALDVGCQILAGAECINNMCLCRYDFYRVDDMCVSRLLSDEYTPVIETVNKTSVKLTWRDLDSTPMFTFVKYKLQWKIEPHGSKPENQDGSTEQQRQEGGEAETSPGEENPTISRDRRSGSDVKRHVGDDNQDKGFVNDEKVINTDEDSDTKQDSWSDVVDGSSTANVESGTRYLFTNESTAAVYHLVPGGHYIINVTAVVVLTDSGQEETLWYRTNIVLMEPNCLMKKSEVFIRESRSLLVHFHNLNGMFDNCYAWVGGLEAEEKSPLKDCQMFSLLSFKFGVPYTLNTRVTSGSAECHDSLTIQLKKRAPTQVSELKSTFPDSSTVSITWYPPSDAHGYLSGYEAVLSRENRIGCLEKYKIVESAATPGGEEGNKPEDGVSQSSSNMHLTRAKQSSNCEEKTKVIQRVVVAQQTLTFDDLEPGATFTVSVAAINDVGVGDWNSLTFTLGSLVPVTPTNLTATSQSTSSVLLEWNPPHPYPGPTSYVISVFVHFNWKTGESASQLIHNETINGYAQDKYLVKELTMATTYDFEIIAVTSEGRSPPDRVVGIQTWEKASPAVENIRVQHSTSDTVTLVWGRPKQLNGKTRAYIVVAVRESSNTRVCLQVHTLIMLDSKIPPQPDAPALDQVPGKVCPNKLTTTSRVIPSQAETTFSVAGLAPNTVYTFQVWPYNGAGLGMVSETAKITENAIPNTPTDINCTATDRGQLMLEWVAPLPYPGETSYKLTIQRASECGRDGPIDFVDLDSPLVEGYSSTSYNKDGLDDYWPYRFYVVASTPSGSSEISQPVLCWTIPAAPGPVSDLEVTSKETSTREAIVQWKCPTAIEQRGIVDRFDLTILPKEVHRSDMTIQTVPSVQMSVDEKQADGGGWPYCTGVYSVTVELVPQVSYSVQVATSVAQVDHLGEVKIYVYNSSGSAPPSLPSPIKAVSSVTSKERDLKSSFKTSVCPTCLLNNVNGEIITFGLGVCKQGFCDQDAATSIAIASLVSWKASQNKAFEIPYKISDVTWRNAIRSQETANSTSFDFIVGSDAKCKNSPASDFCNGPLPSRAGFRVFQFTCTRDGCAQSQLSEVNIIPAPVSNTSSDKIVVGGAASGAAFAVIVILIIVVVRIRLRKVVEITDKTDPLDMPMSVITDSNSVYASKSRPIKICDFEDNLHQLHADNNDLLNLEFTELDMDSPLHSTDVASDPLHRRLNRWSNILPFDHSRVKLSVVDGDENCSDDYINANYIPGFYSIRDYIATQGPLSCTIGDFWRMVWEKHASVVVMLSAFHEEDPRTGCMREKVAPYYPDESQSEGARYGHLQVSCRGKLDNHAWEVRTFHLTHLMERRSRYVKHFFFKSWTDHKADISPQDLITFSRTVRNEAAGYPAAPIVVHCSAGVGRTGTYIAVDYFNCYMRQLSQKSKVTNTGSGKGSSSRRRRDIPKDSTLDIYGRVLTMRDCRRYMVQTKSQYAFIYDTVMELIRQLVRSDDASDSGADTESAASVPPPDYMKNQTSHR